MTRHSYLLCLGIFLLVSCSNKNRSSEIEVVKVDLSIIAEIQSEYDSVFIDSPLRHDFWTIEHYLVNSNMENKILKDSNENVVGIVRRKNGHNYFTAEYYSNGQLKGRIRKGPTGSIEGEAKYYYEDGRIRSIGSWKNTKKIGEWRSYYPSGRLKSIEVYDDNGVLVNEQLFIN